MASPNLGLQAILSNPMYTIFLQHPDTNQSWKAPVINDLSSQASSSFNAPFQDATASANEFLQKAQAVTNNIGSQIGIEGLKFPVPSLLTLSHSIMTWSSSERPQFNITMTFIATSDSDDVQGQAARLASMALPSLDFELADTIQGMTTQIVDKAKNLVGGNDKANETAKEASRNPLTASLRAPAGYAPEGDKARGTFFLQIGNYFKASNLILTDCQIEVSKERFASGRAVWATATCTLVPYRLPTAREYAGFYMTSPGSGTNVLGKSSSLLNQGASLISGGINKVKSLFG